MNWLEEKRSEKGISKSSLAKMLDMNISIIGKYERNERRPSVETAKAIADVLGFDWTKFFEDQPAPEQAIND